MKQIILLNQKIRNFFYREEGMGTVEMVLILFVLVGVVMLFREKVEFIVKKYLTDMDPNLSHPTLN